MTLLMVVVLTLAVENILIAQQRSVHHAEIIKRETDYNHWDLLQDNQMIAATGLWATMIIPIIGQIVLFGFFDSIT